MQRVVILLALLGLLLSACELPLTPVAQARVSAGQQGCWPYGVYQPPTPTLIPTGTPGFVAIVPNATPRPSPTIAPTIAAYPACTPAPRTPTITPSPLPQETPQPRAPIGKLQEIGSVAGIAQVWARSVRSPMVAIHPTRHTAAVAWLTWQDPAQGDAGDVWVRVQNQAGIWMATQAVNTRAVRRFYGGLGITTTVSDTTVVAYGRGNRDGDTQVYITESADDGTTWTDARAIGVGRVIDLTSDAAGGLHLLTLTASGDSLNGVPAYWYRAPQAATWSRSALPTGAQYTGNLAIIARPGGALRRYVFVNDAAFNPSKLTLLWSDDGIGWQQQPVPTGRYFAEAAVATSLLVVGRNGTTMIALAWSQTPGPGPARAGVFARLSLDDGVTWTDEETIALYQTDGAMFDDQNNGLLAGVEPSLVYDAVSDQIAASWVEDDVAKRRTEYGNNIRTVLAARALTSDPTWRYAMTPDNKGRNTPPVLTPWGRRGMLVGLPDGTAHWLIALETRNAQDRVYAEPISLPALLVEGVS